MCAVALERRPVPSVFATGGDAAALLLTSVVR